MEQPKVDWPIFASALVVLVGACAPLMLYPEEGWTVFYWAWWIAFGPFMGIFVAQISQGRTLRQVVVGLWSFGSLGCAFYFIVLGNYALDLEVNGGLNFIELKEAEGNPAAIIRVIATLPFAAVVVPFF